MYRLKYASLINYSPDTLHMLCRARLITELEFFRNAKEFSILKVKNSEPIIKLGHSYIIENGILYKKNGLLKRKSKVQKIDFTGNVVLKFYKKTIKFNSYQDLLDWL